MIDVAFDRVSKRYRIRRPVNGRPEMQDFWAVRDVSFEVTRGETFGLIGHNGAGKSTLMKLLSRITSPTAGEIRFNGRVAALIEVGSGFHPELTGRENVYLSGSILGMKRREIAAKFDRIVDFSGVRGFIDTPVKWYSSGMYVRLGFAIAAHLDADILLVDEVLAVGDAAFQAQCVDRLLEKLCDRVGLMRQGQLAAYGEPHDIVHDYQQTASRPDIAALADATVPHVRVGDARVDAVTFHDETGTEVRGTATGAPLITRVRYHATAVVRDAVVETFFYSRDGRTLHCQQSTAVAGGELTLTPGEGTIEFSSPGFGLQPGVYAIGATIRERAAAETIDWHYGRTLLYVEPGKSVRGYFYAPHEWRQVTHAQVGDRRSHV
jgi:ABC-type polysaccharide/polyol phosphate transport system ATPase subunit